MDPAHVLELPAILQLVFQARPPCTDTIDDEYLYPPDKPEPVLSARDQVCCMATCRSWRQALDPRFFPFAASCVLGNAGLRDIKGTRLPAAWVVKARPGISFLRLELAAKDAEAQSTLEALASLPAEALQELDLDVDCKADFWPLLRRFGRLRHMKLHMEPRIQVDGSKLCHVPPSLESLDLETEWRVIVQGGAGTQPPLLPNLTRLRLLQNGGMLLLNAAMPKLQSLTVDLTQGGVRLRGEHLCLPQLTSFSLGLGFGGQTVDVDFGALRSLHDFNISCLDLNNVPAVRAVRRGIPSLTRLTTLRIGGMQSAADVELASALLWAVPPTLRSLWIFVASIDGGISLVHVLVPALQHTTQLTTLVCSAVATLHCLGPLRQVLRRLTLRWGHFVTAGRLTSHDIAVLADMPCLKCLRFDAKMPDLDSSSGACVERHARMQALRDALPRDCSVLELRRFGAGRRPRWEAAW